MFTHDFGYYEHHLVRVEKVLPLTTYGPIQFV